MSERRDWPDGVPLNDIVLCDFYVHVGILRARRAFIGAHL